MRCPACNFICSNKRDLCPKCTLDLRPHKRSLGLPVLEPDTNVDELRQRLASMQEEFAHEEAPAEVSMVTPISSSASGEQRGFLGRLFSREEPAFELEEPIPPPLAFDTLELEEPPPITAKSQDLPAEVPSTQQPEAPEFEQQVASLNELLRGTVTPTIVPAVMEFGEDDASLEEMLDALLGDEQIAVEAVVQAKKVAVPVVEITAEDEDFEIDVEIDLDQLNEELEDIAGKESQVPSNIVEESVGAGGEIRQAEQATSPDKVAEIAIEAVTQNIREAVATTERLQQFAEEPSEDLHDLLGDLPHIEVEDDLFVEAEESASLSPSPPVDQIEVPQVASQPYSDIEEPVTESSFDALVAHVAREFHVSPLELKRTILEFVERNSTALPPDDDLEDIVDLSIPLVSEELWVDVEREFSLAAAAADAEGMVIEDSELWDPGSNKEKMLLIFDLLERELEDPDDIPQYIEKMVTSNERNIDSQHLQTTFDKLDKLVKENELNWEKPIEPTVNEADFSLESLLKPAPIWRRVFATFADLTLFCVLGIVVGLLGVFSVSANEILTPLATGNFSPEVVPTLVLLGSETLFAATICWALLTPICLSAFGTTLGKKMFRVEVVDDDGFPIAIHQAILRTLLSPIVLLSGGLALLTVFMRKKQALPDLLAHTHVIFQPKVD